MRQRTTGGGPLIVTGPSGAGKTSLLHAGLIATLRQWPGTHVTLLTPDADPVESLAAAFASPEGGADLRARVTEDPAVLADELRGTQGKHVVIVDHLEELFTVCRDEERHRVFSTTAWHIAPTNEARLSMIKTLLHPQRALVQDPDGNLRALAHSPDGSRLITAAADGTVQVWGVGFPADPFPVVCSLTGGPLSAEEWNRYLPDESYDRDVCSP